jgi:biopolymer transport protein ExbD
MRKRRRYEDYGTLADLNVTPLLDLAFTLLVIFIVTMPLLGKVADLVLPSTQATRESLNPAQVEVISLDSRRRLYWNGVPATRAELEQKLAALGGAGGGHGVVVEADRSLNVQDAVDLLDLVSAAGIGKAAIVTSARGEAGANPPGP